MENAVGTPGSLGVPTERLGMDFLCLGWKKAKEAALHGLRAKILKRGCTFDGVNENTH